MSVKYRDYYEVLGVPRDATAKAIRDAYRKLARQYHPDLQDTPAKKKVAEEKFKEINEAHEVLGDPEKRKKYDRLGSRWKDGMDFTPPPGSGQAGSWTWTGGEGFSGGFSDFFEALFGGRGGPFSRGQSSWEWDLDEQAGGRDQGADLGTEVQVPTLDGPVSMRIPPGSQAGQRLRLRGKGLPRRDGTRGDQYVRFVLVTPKSVGPRERELYKELGKLSTENPRSPFSKARAPGR